VNHKVVAFEVNLGATAFPSHRSYVQRYWVQPEYVTISKLLKIHLSSFSFPQPIFHDWIDMEDDTPCPKYDNSIQKVPLVKITNRYWWTYPRPVHWKTRSTLKCKVPHNSIKSCKQTNLAKRWWIPTTGESVNGKRHNLSTLPSDCGRRTTIPHGQLARSERRTYPTDDTASEQTRTLQTKSFGSQWVRKEIPKWISAKTFG